ncbi:non-canonical purine NTP pyrophosphatase [Arenicella chitinivorans]|uniref:dITP/XTP pyrophosphatase n=1 Tax=Arenicella chitinivorans TaxID=1329800 RepID=A0A918RLY1_9GAMM|nr:RdgB/HAM1 family non-canonical purine NTP pyrophosphatase [Arenicella chitinivorans]GHA03489.1 non-canonical purine NTP pyrophosphatase [Arenicella chitinivorans]
MQKVVLATGNVGKVAEMQSTLESLGFSIVPQSEFDIPEAVEDGLTFVENALKKARHACELTGLPAIADDSGLEVRALHGAPGIHSSRYAEGQGDAANNAKLLAALAGVKDRRARFQCVIVYLRHALDPTPIICQGSWQGEITDAPSGSAGFGYDPLFMVPEQGCTAAALPPETKRTLSHRAQALAQLQQALNHL